MKTDSYTKCITTIIAICLVIIVIRDIDPISRVHANDNHTMRYGIIPVNPDGSINVRIHTSDEINVNIRNIDTYDKLKVDLTTISTRDELDINIDEIGGSSVSSGGPMKVKVEN